MIVGAVGPWAKVLFITVNGTDDGKDGWIVLAAAAIAALALAGALVTRRRSFAIVSALAGALGAATAAYDIGDINSTASEHGLPSGIVSTQWAIYVALVASVGLVLSSIALWVETRRAARGV